MILERRELGTPGVQAMVREMGEFGIAMLREQLPALAADGGAALLIVSNAFTGAILDVDGQEALLGGAVATSTRARARLRAELKRVMRAIFDIREPRDARTTEATRPRSSGRSTKRPRTEV
jgi:hypothetical protein